LVAVGRHGHKPAPLVSTGHRSQVTGHRSQVTSSSSSSSRSRLRLQDHWLMLTGVWWPTAVVKDLQQEDTGQQHQQQHPDCCMHLRCHS
jgi:hypothetical protein